MTEDGVKENGLIKAAKLYEQAVQRSKGTFVDAQTNLDMLMRRLELS